LLFFLEKGFCQLKQIPIDLVNETKIEELFCLDSSGKIERFCSIDLQGFTVEFYHAFRDIKTKELRLIGKVYMGKTSEGENLWDI